MEGSIIAFSIIFLFIAFAGAALLRNLEDTLNEISEMNKKNTWISRRYIYNAYISVVIIFAGGIGWLWCLLLMIS